MTLVALGASPASGVGVGQTAVFELEYRFVTLVQLVSQSDGARVNAAGARGKASGLVRGGAETKCERPLWTVYG